jgi:hypothetical protein
MLWNPAVSIEMKVNSFSLLIRGEINLAMVPTDSANQLTAAIVRLNEVCLNRKTMETESGPTLTTAPEIQRIE